jgi:hypothetical protein
VASVAADSKAFLAHWLWVSPERLIAASTALRSLAVRRMDIPGASALFLGTFGRPYLFINDYKTAVFLYWQQPYKCITFNARKENDMANKLKIERKSRWFPCWRKAAASAQLSALPASTRTRL